jgi:hypothetical protein
MGSNSNSDAASFDSDVLMGMYGKDAGVLEGMLEDFVDYAKRLKNETNRGELARNMRNMDPKKLKRSFDKIQTTNERFRSAVGGEVRDVELYWQGFKHASQRLYFCFDRRWRHRDHAELFERCVDIYSRDIEHLVKQVDRNRKASRKPLDVMARVFLVLGSYWLTAVAHAALQDAGYAPVSSVPQSVATLSVTRDLATYVYRKTLDLVNRGDPTGTAVTLLSLGTQQGGTFAPRTLSTRIIPTWLSSVESRDLVVPSKFTRALHVERVFGLSFVTVVSKLLEFKDNDLKILLLLAFLVVFLSVCRANFQAMTAGARKVVARSEGIVHRHHLGFVSDEENKMHGLMP